MNLDELRSVEEGEFITFIGEYDSFTKGKKYQVDATGVGRMVYNDDMMGMFLYGNDLYIMFEKQVGRCLGN